MNKKEEQSIIARCFDYVNRKETTKADCVTRIATQRYRSKKRFDLEIEALFKTLPNAIMHASELPSTDSAKRVKTVLGSVIVSRDAVGAIQVFHNACRHRGAELIGHDQVCSQSLVCPYHAWRYDTQGKLLNIPSEDSCFPRFDKSLNSLISIPSCEYKGMIWLCASASDQEDALAQVVAHLASVESTLNWMNLSNLNAFKSVTKTWKCNWKILGEGGMETYHFAKAHRKTITPFFTNNIAVIDKLGPHHRVVIPSMAVMSAQKQPVDSVSLRSFTHTLLSLMPQSNFLIQEKHVDWIRVLPISANESELTITSLIPDNVDTLTEIQKKHWKTNFSITLTTLDEDFELGESIQRSVDAGAVTHLNLGRNEGALKAFNDYVDQVCSTFQMRASQSTSVSAE